MEQTVGILLGAAGIYLLTGFLFALAFVLKGAARIDPAARDATLGFKLLVIPGTMVFWPLLAKRWLGGTTEPPEECSPHRSCHHCPKGKSS